MLGKRAPAGLLDVLGKGADGQLALVWDQEHGEVVKVDSQPITGVTVAAGGPPPTR